MSRRIALLRAVNIGSHNRVAMSDLRGLLEGMGFEDPRTVLQSGNLVFGSDGRASARLEEDLHEAVRSRLGVDTDVLVRTPEEWAAVIEDNPFPAEAEDDPGHLLVVFLAEPPVAARVRALHDAIQGREVVRPGDRHLYIHYPDGVGRSRLTAALIEKHLGTRGTARNWKTVLKLAALVAG